MSWWDNLWNGTDTSQLNNALGVTNNSNLPYQNATTLMNHDVGVANQFGQQQAMQYNQLAQDQAAIGSQQQYLTGLMQGKNSVSAEQLRQGLGQQLAQQQAMAAGASPNNSAMAARNAAMNMGQASYGMAGQQALAGLQERNQAASQLANLNLGAGQLASNTALGYAGAQNQALGNAGGIASSWLGNQQKSAGQFGLGILASMGAAASDRRLKTDIKGDDNDRTKSRAILKAIEPYTYKYKDPRFGEGEQYGVLAQDMEKAGLGHAVMNTPYGKMVHAGKAATAGLALTASLAKRVDELEKIREGQGKKASTEEDDED